MPKKKEPQEIPLTQLLKGFTHVFVLSVLKEGPSYGYAIAVQIATRSGNELEFKEGTLYPLLHTMEREGLVKSDWEDVPSSARRRRVYAITDKGAKELEARMAALKKLNKAVHDVTGIEPVH